MPLCSFDITSAQVPLLREMKWIQLQIWTNSNQLKLDLIKAEVVKDIKCEKTSPVIGMIQACGVKVTFLRASLINYERVTPLPGPYASHFMSTVVLQAEQWGLMALIG